MISRGTRLAVLAAGLLAACLGGTLPARELYRLRPVAAATSSEPAAPADTGAWILVEPYVTPGLYADPQIVYRVGETMYGAYPNREWALPLSTMLASLTLHVLRASPSVGGRATDDPAVAGGAGGLVWRATVREFEEVDREKQVFAAVHFDVLLVRAADDSVLWQGSTKLERPVPHPTMTAVVDALSSAATTAIAALVREAEPAIRGTS